MNPIHFLSVDNLGRYKSQRRADDGAFLSDVKEVGQTAYVVEPVVVVWEFDGIKMSCYQNRHVVFKDQYQDVTTLSLIKATLGAKRWADNLQDYGDFELAYQEARSSVLGQAAREDIVDLLMQTYGIDEYPYKSIAETIDTKVTVESRKPII